MMSKHVNIAVIGGAKIADRSILPAIRGLSELYELVGVACRDQEKAIQFATRHETKPFSDYEALLDSKPLDAVYIPLPNAMHGEWIRKALERGLHVLVEKSLTCSYEETLRLNRFAEKMGLALVENFQFRFHSQLAAINKVLSDGVIGEIRCIRSSFGFPPFPDQENIRYQSELGGGALLDAGAYPIKISQYFLGNDLTVAAANLVYDLNKKVDIWGGAYLKQRYGECFAEIAFGFDNFYQCNLEIWGSKGKVYTHRIFTAPPNLAPELILETASGTETLKLKADHSFENMLRHFHMLVKNKQGMSTEYEQNVSQARLIDELRSKAQP